jgi:tetratricopeptide (TPR) repeat protein
MSLFNKNKFEEAVPILEKSFESKDLSGDTRIYSAIALSMIFRTKPDYSAAVSVLENAREKIRGNEESGKDLLISLCSLYLNKNVRHYSKAYLISSELINKYENDPNVISNYSLACMYYAGYLRSKNLTDPKIKVLFTESIAQSIKLIQIAKKKSIRGQAFNTIGMVNYLLGEYEPAITNFHLAIKENDKPIYHRNLGWALFGGKSKTLTGKQKYVVLKEALNEFQTAIKNGDVDKTTMNQIPDLKSQVDSSASKYEKSINDKTAH